MTIAGSGLVDLPRRVYDTKVEAMSGTVSGSLIHGGGGGSTTLSTLSGSIRMTIYPVGVGAEDGESTLTTQSRSGSTSLTMKPPAGGGKITSLSASHKSIGSGSQRIEYPAEWEGRVHASSLGSGSVHASGAGLQIERYGNKDLVGWRGLRTGRTVDVSSVGSGSINFKC